MEKGQGETFALSCRVSVFQCLSTALTLKLSQPSKETIPQSQAASPVLTSVTRGGTRVTSLYQLTELVYR